MAGLRQLTLADREGGLALSTASDWNQTAEDWHRILTVAAAWGIEDDGQLVATTSAIHYGDHLGWIGMVLTAQSHRGRGLATHLMTVALDHLSGCALVKLDATDLGAPLYRRLGFENEGIITRYVGRPTPGDCAMEGPPGPDAFEADRSLLLASLGSPLSLEDGSFAYTRPGRRLPFFGPCVGNGEPLLRCFAAQQAGEFLLDRMGDAPAGFRPARRLMRMYRGRFRPTSERQFSGAGFEFG